MKRLVEWWRLRRVVKVIERRSGLASAELIVEMLTAVRSDDRELWRVACMDVAQLSHAELYDLAWAQLGLLNSLLRQAGFSEDWPTVYALMWRQHEASR